MLDSQPIHQMMKTSELTQSKGYKYIELVLTVKELYMINYASKEGNTMKNRI